MRISDWSSDVCSSDLADDPCAAIDSPRQGRSLPKILTEPAVDALLAAAQARPGPEGVRLVAFLELLHGAGLRATELVALPASVAGPRIAPVLLVRGKGRTAGVAPLHEAAVAAVAERRRVVQGREVVSREDS